MEETNKVTDSVRRLHIGGFMKVDGWEIYNVLDLPDADHRGLAQDLSRFEDNTFNELYSSHVVEHFGYNSELIPTLKEWRRVLKPEGYLYVSVPDLDILSRMVIDKKKYTFQQRFHIMRMIFGGQINEFDFHKVGLNEEFLTWFLQQAGYRNIKRVQKFGFFDDTSELIYEGIQISVNIIAQK